MFIRHICDQHINENNMLFNDYYLMNRNMILHKVFSLEDDENLQCRVLNDDNFCCTY